MRILITLCCLFTLACRPAAQISTAPVPAKPAAFVTWDKTMIQLGTVTRGEQRDMFFEFTNVSAETIKIDIVDACECTTTDFPRGNIAPGQKGKITARFDSKDKTAAETIDIRVIFQNTDAEGNPRVETVQYAFDIQ